MIQTRWASLAFTYLVLIRLSFHVILEGHLLASKLEGLLEIICLTPRFTDQEAEALTGLLMAVSIKRVMSWLLPAQQFQRRGSLIQSRKVAASISLVRFLEQPSHF